MEHPTLVLISRCKAVLVVAFLLSGWGVSPCWAGPARIDLSASWGLHLVSSQKARKGLSVRTRYTQTFLDNGLGYFVRADWPFHPLAPIGGVGPMWRFNHTSFDTEIGAGALIGILAGRGFGILGFVNILFEVTSDIFISVPFQYRWDYGIWNWESTPYLGFRI